MASLWNSSNKGWTLDRKPHRLRYEQLEQRRLLSINNNAIIGSVFVDSAANGVFDESDTPLANQVVYVDQNRNGVMDRHRFRASRLELAPISTNTSTRYSINIPDFDSVADIDLLADIEHTRPFDLAMALVSPRGTRVDLFATGDLSVSGLDIIRFDDQADQSIQTLTDSHPDNVRPAGWLSDFNGEESGGTWYLEFQDTGHGSLGQLNSWHLEFTTGDYVALSNAAGEYSFYHLPDDPGEVHAQPLHSWSRVIEGRSPDGLDFGVVQDGRIEGTVFHDSDVDGVRHGEPGLLDRTVFLDENSNARREIQQIVVSNNTSEPIVDFHTTKSEIQMAGLEGHVLDINVRLNIRHTWNDDLDVFLTSPAGTRVELMTDIGENRDDFWGTILDDEAEEYITDNFLSYGLTFQPEGTLADFDGEDPNGTWNLVIEDDDRRDEGLLDSWSIDITYGEPAALSDEEGVYLFDNLPGGFLYQVKLLDQIGWLPTMPSPFSVLVENGKSVLDRDIGTARRHEVGDFDQNGVLDCSDVDLILADMKEASNHPIFDLTLDGRVDELDLDTWLVRSAQASLPEGEEFRRGDANLDGKVNSSDLNIIGRNWLQPVASWCRGDFTADGVVDAHDLNHVGINWQLHISSTAALSVGQRAPRAPLGQIVAVTSPGRLDPIPHVTSLTDFNSNALEGLPKNRQTSHASSIWMLCSHFRVGAENPSELLVSDQLVDSIFEWCKSQYRRRRWKPNNGH